MNDSKTFSLPPNLVLEINHRCNYHCPWCYCIWHETGLAMRNLPMSAWEQIIKLAAQFGVRSLLFTGGEATLRNGWQELLRFARRQLPDGEIALFTNGSHFTEADLRFCIRHNIRLAVSLPGVRSYPVMTGTHRSYRRTLELLMKAQELHHPCSVSVTVTQGNLAEIEDVYAAAVMCGAAVVQLNAMMLAGRAHARTDWAVSPKDWQTLKQRMAKVTNPGVPIIWNGETYCHCEHPETAFDKWKLQENAPCQAGKNFGVFGPDGWFRKCLHTKDRLIYWKDFLQKETMS